MTDGQGVLTLPPRALVTIDPYSRVLRRAAHIEAWQADEAARKKSKAAK